MKTPNQTQSQIAVEMLMVTKTNLTERYAAVVGLLEYVESADLHIELDTLSLKLSRVSNQLDRLIMRFPEIAPKNEPIAIVPDCGFDPAAVVDLELQCA